MSAVIPIGIDLGTTFSATARINHDGRTELIANSRGQLLTPSAVLFDELAVHVGLGAWEAAETAPERLAEHVKRDMGQQFFRESIRGHQYPPEIIQSCILRELRRDIAAAVGENFQAVITVPAYFDELRRKVTADAGTMSGLDVLDIVNEPTAAALAFGEKLGYLDPHGGASECLKLLVYDLGGGTFDVTIIELAPGRVRTLVTDGDVELGGMNWDERLAEYAEQEFRRRWPDAGEFTRIERIRLRRAAERTKIELSTRPLTTLEFVAQGKQMSLPVTVNEFNELTEDLLERTCFTTRHAVQAAGLLWRDIDRLLLVGGSTRIPAVRKALTELSGIEPDDQVHPDEAVARGAAIFAHHLLANSGKADSAAKLAITDVNAHGLGIEGVNQQTLRRENVILIPRNTPLPHEVCRSFVTKSDGQRTVKIQLLEGESCLPEQCADLASAAIRHLPPGLPAGTKIDVWYSFRANGRLEVRASVPNLGDPAHIELERVRGLDDDNVVRWKNLIARDGGYTDFEDAVAYYVTQLDARQRRIPTEPPARTESPSSFQPSSEPSVPFGAPQAAANRLQVAFSGSGPPEFSEIPDNGVSSVVAISQRRRPNSRPFPMWARLLGHVVASAVGLAIGYYVLCWIRPEANFLNLDLPGLNR